MNEEINGNEQLHPNKRGREDCADCPTPDTHCSECINRASPKKRRQAKTLLTKELAK